MKRARRVDNGELVQGYLTHDDLIRPIEAGCVLATKDMSADGEFSCHVIRIYPPTVEDVAVKPSYSKWNGIHGRPYAHCPCCNSLLVDKKDRFGSASNYCNTCGQRIDWSGDDGE